MLLCFTKKQSAVHPPSLFSPSTSHCFSRLCVHRQAVGAEAGIMSTPTSPEVKELNPVDFIQLQQYIECEYRQTDRQASRRLLQRSTSPPRTHFHPHTLIYPRSWFLISRSSSSLTPFLKMQLKYKLAFYFECFLMYYLNKRPQRDGAFWSNYRSAHVQLAAALVWPLCPCLQTAAWRWKTCWGNLIKTAGWPSTDMERWGGSEGTPCPAALALDSLMLMLAARGTKWSQLFGVKRRYDSCILSVINNLELLN